MEVEPLPPSSGSSAPTESAKLSDVVDPASEETTGRLSTQVQSDAQLEMDVEPTESDPAETVSHPVLISAVEPSVAELHEVPGPEPIISEIDDTFVRMPNLGPQPQDGPEHTADAPSAARGAGTMDVEQPNADKTDGSSTEPDLLRPCIIEEPDPDEGDESITVEVVEPSRASSPEPDEEDEEFEVPQHIEHAPTPHLVGGESDSEGSSGVRTPPLQAASGHANAPVAVADPEGEGEVENQAQSDRDAMKLTPSTHEVHESKITDTVKSVRDMVDCVGLVNAKWEDLDFDML